MKSNIIVGDARATVDGLVAGRRVVAITDTNVARLHAQFFAGRETIVVGAGEAAKTLDTVAAIYRRLMALHADRQTFVLGVGGGVVTDLAGFAAATYMRGVAFGFVPTTLLGQVDAAIGGKNGVDIDGFKNMAGTFAMPEFVAIDTSFLTTLPDREFRAGLAEAVKAGVVGDPVLFDILEQNSFDEIRQNDELLAEIIRRAAAVKTAIVARDPLEKGERRLLNLGHTVGHAVEKAGSRYSPEPAEAKRASVQVAVLHPVTAPDCGLAEQTHEAACGGPTVGGGWLHGEAVAVGLAAAAGVAVRLGVLAPSAAARITAALASLGLPVAADIDRAAILAAIAHDKKGAAGGIRFVLPTAVGACEVRTLTLEELERLL